MVCLVLGVVQGGVLKWLGFEYGTEEGELEEDYDDEEGDGPFTMVTKHNLEEDEYDSEEYFDYDSFMDEEL